MGWRKQLFPQDRGSGPRTVTLPEGRVPAHRGSWAVATRPRALAPFLPGCAVCTTCVHSFKLHNCLLSCPLYRWGTSDSEQEVIYPESHSSKEEESGVRPRHRTHNFMHSHCKTDGMPTDARLQLTTTLTLHVGTLRLIVHWRQKEELQKMSVCLRSPWTAATPRSSPQLGLGARVNW